MENVDKRVKVTLGTRWENLPGSKRVVALISSSHFKSSFFFQIVFHSIVQGVRIKKCTLVDGICTKNRNHIFENWNTTLTAKFSNPLDESSCSDYLDGRIILTELVQRLRQVDLHCFLSQVKKYLRQALDELLSVPTDGEYVSTDENSNSEESIEK